MIKKLSLIILGTTVHFATIHALSFTELCALTKSSETKATRKLNELSKDTLAQLAATGKLYSEESEYYGPYCLVTPMIFDWTRLKEIDAANTLIDRALKLES